MKISIKPTSQVLVGVLLICIFLIPELADGQLNGLEQLNKFKEQSFYSRHHEKSADLGILKVGAESIYFPWFSRKTMHVRPDLSGSFSASASKKEEILMNGSKTFANVDDMSAINSLKQRDLLYKDSQNGDPGYQGLVNSLDITVSGNGNDNVGNSSAKRFADDFEAFADEPSGMIPQEDNIDNNEFGKSDIHHVGNYLNVDVHDISVSAVNTIKGGSATATSNIIIEPVQIIVCPSEVGVKLK